MLTTIGTCSICGGPVQVPSIWGGIIPPTPTCAQCGAQAATHGPIIQMRPAGVQALVEYTTVSNAAVKGEK